MSYIYASLVLLLAYFLGALLLIRFVPDLNAYLDIVRTCEVAGLSLEPCRSGALTVAASSLGALALVGLVALALDTAQRGVARNFPLDDAAPRWLLVIFLAALATVLVAHNLHRAAAPPAPAVRIPSGESALVSLENLSWPLLLQLLFWTRDRMVRLTIVAFLGAIIALSPFRGVLFASVYFAALVPLGVRLWSVGTRKRRAVWLASLAVVLIVGAMAVGILYQTHARRVEAALAGSAIGFDTVDIMKAIVSRAMSPFFQAELVEQIAQNRPTALPTISRTVSSKFRFGSEPSLNRYLYAMLYQGGADGQTTSLWFGESAANTAMWPIYWMVSGPIFLLLVYRTMRNFMDAGVLIAVALWRGAMGGLFDVLPALALQTGFCVAVVLACKGRVGK